MANPYSVNTEVLGARTRRSKRVPLRILAVLILLIAGLALWARWRIRASLPQLDGSLELPGLHDRVEVLRDARGVPHVRARSLDDALFAQGYVTAQDRLWQMDLSRRLAWGELSEVFGRRMLPADIENRTLGFRQVAERAVGQLSPQSRQLLSDYSRGVNAFMDSHRSRLPIEFMLLHYQPRPWTDMDCFAIPLNMSKALNSSWRTDLMREEILGRVGPQLYKEMFPDASPLDHPVAEPVKGPVRTAQPDGAGRLVDLSPAGAAGVDPVLAALLAPGLWPDSELGSNSWVVNGAHTRSGKPLLSNDPHLHHSLPSVWYQIQLEAPGIDVTGVSLPGAPTVIIGHNERIAWGMTNTGPDTQDLFVEKFDPNDSTRYLDDGRWEKAGMRDEVIHVRGGKDDHLRVRATRHGPVVAEQGGRALALEWTALDPRALGLTVFLELDQALNWQQFKDALRNFSSPEQNMVYADIDGNIGYYAPGWVPVRKKGDGSLPVPGDTDEYDWQGYIPFEDLPHAFNPPGGIIATANSRVVPADYPYLITHDWAAPWRTARIFQLLESGRSFTVEDMLRIDRDIDSPEDVTLARWLLKAGEARPPHDPDVQYALGLLWNWNGEATIDSGATLVCEVTRPILLQRLLQPKLGEDYTLYHWGLASAFVRNVIENNRTEWLPPGDADLNDTLIKSLEEGVRKIPEIVHSRDRRAWRWGYTIPLIFHHPLDGLPFGKQFFDVGPLPQWGMRTTIKATTPVLGPSMRMVVDFSDLDRSVNNITLGESGQVSNPYYKDQFEAWYHGRSFPMLFSDPTVTRGAAHRLTLEPAGMAGAKR